MNQYLVNPGSYKEVLDKFLEPYRVVISCLEKRLALLGCEAVNKNEYEHNELEIAKIKTQAEITCRSRIMRERQAYNDKFMRGFLVDIDDLKKNWDRVVLQAKAGVKTNNELAKTVPYIQWNDIEGEIEAKIAVYKMLKKHLKR